MKTLRIDYGATRARYILPGESEREVASTTESLREMLDRLLGENKEVEAVAVSYAGQVRKGVILASPNIDKEQKNIGEYIQTEYGIPLKIENDLKCAALAEYHAKKEATTLFAAYIGTGFGGAFIENGTLFRGAGNLAGEIGHIPFKKAPIRCGCGKDDCVEIYCSGIGLSKWVDYYGLECEPTLAALDASRDERAKEILHNFYEALSHALSTMVTIINPKYLILGGSVILNNPGLVGYIKESLGKIAFKASVEDLRIETSAFKNGCLEGTKWL